MPLESASAPLPAALLAAPSAPPPCATAEWSWPVRCLFRFAFVWFLLQVLQPAGTLLPIGRLGELGAWLDRDGRPAAARSAGAQLAKLPQAWSDHLQKPVAAAVDEVVLRVANLAPVQRITGRSFEARPPGMGSGDTTCDWVEIATITAVALLAALAWSALARRKTAHPRLHDLWRVLLRFELATWLVVYGTIKLIPTQMPLPDLARLTEPVGEMSPMGMLWTFLGSSPAYQSYSGSAELLAGALLVTRWTTPLGAFAAFAVMGNVFVMNLCYDVPVKIFSGRLMLQALALAAPELPRLWRGFVLHRALPARPVGALFRWKSANAIALLAGIALFGDATGSGIRSLLEQRSQRAAGSAAATSPIEGIWVVEEFEHDGAPAVGDEPYLWRKLVVGNPWSLAIETRAAPWTRYFTQADPLAKESLALSRRGDAQWRATLRTEREADDLLSLTGEFDGRELWVRLRRIETPPFPLLTRGFRWVNEFPYNR